MEWLHHWFKF